MRAKFFELENDGPLVVPFAFHFTFPDNIKPAVRHWLQISEDDMGCLKFKEVDAMDNEYDKGVLFAWMLNDDTGCAAGMVSSI